MYRFENDATTLNSIQSGIIFKSARFKNEAFCIGFSVHFHTQTKSTKICCFFDDHDDSYSIVFTTMTQYGTDARETKSIVWYGSLEDLRLGRHEAKKRVLLKRFVQKRAIIKDPEGGRFPPRVLRSELLDFMVEACV